MKIWFTADTHFGHANIIRYCSRPFRSVGEMDATLLMNINAVVRPDDVLYHLGDFAMGSREDRVEDARRYRNSIACRNVILIRGNHDPRNCPHFDELFSAVHELYDLNTEGRHVVMCHYAMRVWNRSHRGSWQLYGHDHGRLPEIAGVPAFDVGVDCWDFLPIDFGAVRTRMKAKGIRLERDEEAGR